MPIYEFRCKDCNAVTESLSLSIDNAPDQVKCGQCGGTNTEKLIASGFSHRMESPGGKHVHNGRCCGGSGGTDCIPGSCCGQGH